MATHKHEPCLKNTDAFASPTGYHGLLHNPPSARPGSLHPANQGQRPGGDQANLIDKRKISLLIFEISVTTNILVVIPVSSFITFVGDKVKSTTS